MHKGCHYFLDKMTMRQNLIIQRISNLQNLRNNGIDPQKWITTVQKHHFFNTQPSFEKLTNGKEKCAEKEPYIYNH